NPAESWLVPIVLRWADDGGAHESRLLLTDRAGSLRLGARGEVKYVCANRGGAGFYRVKYPPAELAALAKHGAELPPVERVNLVALIAKLLAPRLTRLGWDPPPGELGPEPDERRLERAQVVRALALVARDPRTIDSVKKRLPSSWRGEAPLDPNLLDAASVAS